MSKRHGFRSIFSIFFDQKIPLLFIPGALFLGIAGNAAFSLVMKIIGDDSPRNLAAVLVLSTVGLLVIVLLLAFLLPLFTRKASVGDSVAFSVERRGVIYTVGKQVETLMFSLENQKPDHIGFIFSIVSESYVNDLITKMRLEEDRCKKKVVDAGNVVEIRSDTKLLIEWMRANGLTNRDIVVDVTGGMTTMSVGAFSMAEEMNIDTQYITSDYDDKNRPIRGTERGVFVKRYSRGN